MFARTQQDPPLLRIERFGGVDFSSTPTQIAEFRSPDMLNMILDEVGAANKRPGYDKVIQLLGQGPINGIYEYTKKDGTSYFLCAFGTNLYTLNEE